MLFNSIKPIISSQKTESQSISMLFGLWNPILSCYKKSNAHLGIGIKTYSEAFLMEIKGRFAINQTPIASLSASSARLNQFKSCWIFKIITDDIIRINPTMTTTFE